MVFNFRYFKIIPIIIASVREFKLIDWQNPHLQVKYEINAKNAQKIIPLIFSILIPLKQLYQKI